MKEALLVFTHDGRHPAAELPYLLGRAGYTTTILAHKNLRPFIGKGYARWIDAPKKADEIVAQLVRLIAADEKAYDWIIPCDDHVLSALMDSALSDADKARLGPVRNAAHLDIAGSKSKVAEFCAAQDVPVPPFRVCTSIEDIQRAAPAIGFPLMIKIDRSMGSEGVFKCRDAGEIETYSAQLRSGIFHVEKFIAGTHVRMEPLFKDGHLIACSASTPLRMLGDGVGLITKRRAMSVAPFEAELRKIGSALGLNGFISVGYVVDGDNKHYLYELDCRPNTWQAYGRFIGADFAAGLRAYDASRNAGGDFSAAPYLSAGDTAVIGICHRDIPRALRRLAFGDLWWWIANRDHSWQCIPLHDPRLVLFWLWHIVVRGAKFAARRLLSRIQP